MSHPEIDPLEELLLRIATTYEVSYDQCVDAYNLFVNMLDGDKAKAFFETEQAAEQAQKTKAPLMSAFYPFLLPSGVAQERVAFMNDTGQFSELEDDPSNGDVAIKEGPFYFLLWKLNLALDSVLDIMWYSYQQLIPLPIKTNLLAWSIALTDNLAGSL
jgi:hypothetical protein